MMTLPSFEFLAPTTVKEAAELMRLHGDKAKILAGGTDLIPSMKNKLFSPDKLISLQNVKELNSISYDENNGLRLGAMVTLTDIGTHPLVAKNYPVLSLAAQKVATTLLQNKGTIGGNILLDTRCYYYNQSEFWRNAINNCLKKDGDVCRVAPSGHRCYAISSCDTVPGLYAMDARLKLVCADGERVVPLRDFYQNDGMAFNSLKINEVLAEIQIPPLPKGFRGAYIKLRRRKTIDYPMLGVMIGLTLDEKEVCRDAKIILGAVFSMPFEVKEAQDILIGKKITETEINLAAEKAHEVAKPLDLTNFRPAYRKKMVKVFTKRILNILTQKNAYVDELTTDM